MTADRNTAGGGIQLNIPDVIRQLLSKRGMNEEEAVKKFLFPSLADLPDPRLMQDLGHAATLVVSYLEADKKIVIWGDYDVDGTTGTALLVNFFKEIGVTVDWHIPNRLTEGYGLNIDWFSKNVERFGNDFLLITVDCGISNAREIEGIKKLGGKVIITDHHTIPEEGVPNCMVLNPSRTTCGFHGEQLAGVGVAFYLAAGIRACFLEKRSPGKITSNINLKRYLAFVAMGTIADVVHLTPTNRILVRAGVEALADNDFVGLQHLLSVCEIENCQIPAEEIGYTLGPKLNAAGRLGHSRTVVELLTTEDPRRAKRLANKLIELNRERQRITENNLEKALTLVSLSSIETNKCVVVRGDMHVGVAGIVAAKLVEIYGVPALVFARIEKNPGQAVYSGSARSVEGVNIIELLNCCSPWIERFGGHKMAAGLTVREENFAGFEKLLIAKMVQATKERTIIRSERFDLQCSVDTIMSTDCLEFMKFLEPFGPGNEQPVFEDPSAEIIDSRKVGRESEHLQLTIRGKYSKIKGIGFGLAESIDEIQQQPIRRLLFTPTINRFRGTRSWQVRIIDV